jgi:hypothetical protein
MVLRFVQLKEQGGTGSPRGGQRRGPGAQGRGGRHPAGPGPGRPPPCATLAEAAQANPLGAEIDIPAALAEGRVLAPIDHPDPAHLVLTGTGLTHLGSAEGRDKMHKAALAQKEGPANSSPTPCGCS